MSKTMFTRKLDELITKCEDEMLVSGWLDPNFDESAYRGTSVANVCCEIESLLFEFNVIREGSIAGLAHAHPARSPIGKLSLYHHETLLIDVASAVDAVKLPLPCGIPTSLGFVAIRPVKEISDETTPPYLGPFIAGYLEISGTIGDVCSAVLPRQQYTNPFGLLRLRDAQFTPLEVAPISQHNQN